MYKIGVIGCGNMGEAILKCVRNKYSISIHEKDKGRCAYIRSQYKLDGEDLETVVENSDVIIIAVKPQDIEGALKEIGLSMTSKKLLISIAAGITTAFIEKSFSRKIRVIRTMPNMPAIVGQGITALAPGRYAQESDIKMACRIFDHLGKTVVVREGMMDTITAVSGSGPGYVFLFMEYMIKAAESLGLKKDLSRELVETTFTGSVQLLEKQKVEAAVLRSKVTSKGGTTEAAIEVFDKNHLDQIMKEALTAARRRAAELRKEITNG